MGKRYTSTIDSFGVDEHMLRVSGRVTVQQSDASEMPYDGEVLVVMLGRMTAPTYGETKDGDVIRVNVMKPIEVKVVKELKDRRKIMEKLYFEHEAQLVFTDMASGAEAGPSESPITLLSIAREAKAVLESDPEIDSAEVEITGGFNPSTEIDTNVLGQDVPFTGYDDEYDDQPVLIDDSPIEEDFVVEGEPEPVVIHDPPIEEDAYTSEDEEYVPNYEDVSDEDEAEFLRQFMSKTPPASENETHRRVKVGGQAEHDPILRNFLEVGS